MLNTRWDNQTVVFLKERRRQLSQKGQVDCALFLRMVIWTEEPEGELDDRNQWIVERERDLFCGVTPV